MDKPKTCPHCSGSGLSEPLPVIATDAAMPTEVATDGPLWARVYPQPQLPALRHGIPFPPRPRR